MNVALPPQIEALTSQRTDLIASLRTRPRGLSWCAENTAIVDAVVAAVASSVCDGELPFCVVAVGGYGRNELSPYSDVDLAVVPAQEDPALLDPAVRAFFRTMGEAARVLQLDLGYSFLLISDIPGLDGKSRTGLLDSRLVAGPAETYGVLSDALAETMPPGEFILEKIREREEAFRRYHDTPLVVEPHLKEGAGGLRCFQTASWLGMAIGQQALRKTRSYSYVTRVRNLLHAHVERKNDHLTRVRRDELAEAYGLDPYELSSTLCKASLELHRAYGRAKDSIQEARFVLAKGVYAARGEVRIQRDADAGEAAAGIAIATDLGLRVEDLQTSAGDTLSGSAAAFSLSHGEATVRNLDRAGLLERLVPELTACRTLVSRDNVHVYTVFEHSLRVIRALDSLQPGTSLGNLMDSITSLQPLYIAALLHDVGKIDPDRSHSEVGAEMARCACIRWGLGGEFVSLVEWLVKEHLTMARFIRLRDIENPETVREFAAIVQTPERLDLLTLLTWADVNAVSASAWTQAQETFLRTLHEATTAVLHEGSPPEADAPTYRQRIARQFRGADVDEAKVQEFIDSLPAHYLSSTSPALARLHYHLAEKAKGGETIVDVHALPELGATEFTICCQDAPALLSRLLGVLYAYDLTLLGVRASTTQSEPPVALDVLTASFGGRVVPSATAAQVANALTAVIEARQDPREILVARGKNPDRIQRAFSYTFVKGTPAVVEIRAPRGRGMPYRFSHRFSELGWNILAARVGQWADSAAAAFYLVGPEGRALTEEEVAQCLKDPVAG